MKRMPVLLMLLVFCLATLWVSPFVHAESEELILGYDSRIVVQTDGAIVVSETIRVVSTGDKIKHGIYRNFPTRYRDEYGNACIVAFQVLEIFKDGQPVAWQ